MRMESVMELNTGIKLKVFIGSHNLSFPTWFSDNENCTTNMLHGSTKEVI